MLLTKGFCRLPRLGGASLSVYLVRGVRPGPSGRAAGSSDITSLYTAGYGVLPVGMKVFVRVNQFVDGWEDPGVTFSGIVPASV